MLVMWPVALGRLVLPGAVVTGLCLAAGCAPKAVDQRRTELRPCESIIGKPKHQWLPVSPEGLVPERMAGYDRVRPIPDMDWQKWAVYRSLDRSCVVSVSFVKDLPGGDSQPPAAPREEAPDYEETELNGTPAGLTLSDSADTRTLVLIFRYGDAVCEVAARSGKNQEYLREHLIMVAGEVLSHLRKIKAPSTPSTSSGQASSPRQDSGQAGQGAQEKEQK